MNCARILQHVFGFLVERRQLTTLGMGAVLDDTVRGGGTRNCCRTERRGHEAYSLNAQGPFYSEDDGCITCMAPHFAAPDLMGFYEDPSGANARSHCFFKMQPQTEVELDRAIRAIQVSCVQNLQYRGSDPAILKRLSEMGFGSLCDALEQDQTPDETPA